MTSGEWVQSRLGGQRGCDAGHTAETRVVVTLRPVTADPDNSCLISRTQPIVLDIALLVIYHKLHEALSTSAGSGFLKSVQAAVVTVVDDGGSVNQGGLAAPLNPPSLRLAT